MCFLSVLQHTNLLLSISSSRLKILSQRVLYIQYLTFVLNFNLIIMPKPKYIVILMGIFCSIVASGASHFYLFFFSVNDWQGLVILV